VDRAPIPSLMRGFSAPVVLDDGLGVAQRLIQMAHDPDPFTRWEAGQAIARGLLLGDIEAAHAPSLIRALGQELERAGEDPAFAALSLRLPDLNDLIQAAAQPDPDTLFAALEALRRAIAETHRAALSRIGAERGAAVFSPSADAAGKRALKAAALDLLAALGAGERALLLDAFEHATCMTETMAALSALGAAGVEEFDAALERFYARWRDNPLVIDKWFSVQAASPRADAAARVNKLKVHPDFELRNPNRVRALVAAFAMRNPRAFHAADGSGYGFVAELVREIDPLNPALAARLLTPFESWKRFDLGRQAAARAELEQIRALNRLSKNTAEVIERTLA
jgi:aminopeptidase N